MFKRTLSTKFIAPSSEAIRHQNPKSEARGSTWLTTTLSGSRMGRNPKQTRRLKREFGTPKSETNRIPKSLNKLFGTL
jgi:hypothetical protein